MCPQALFFPYHRSAACIGKSRGPEHEVEQYLAPLGRPPSPRPGVDKIEGVISYAVGTGKRIGMHEEFGREHKVEGASNRRFGLVIGGVFLLLGGARAYLHGEFLRLDAFFLILGAVLALAGLVAPVVLGPVNRGWGGLGVLLHKITNPLFLGAIFVVGVIPTGLVMRALGADPMRRRTGGPEGYWIKRAKKASNLHTLKQPF